MWQRGCAAFGKATIDSSKPTFPNRAGGGRALVFEYRLAPEHPFPAALDDAMTAYRWLLDQGVPAERIIFAGEGAGAGLAIATVLALKAARKALPAAGGP